MRLYFVQKPKYADWSVVIFFNHSSIIVVRADMEKVLWHSLMEFSHDFIELIIHCDM